MGAAETRAIPGKGFEAEALTEPIRLAAIEDDWRRLAELRANAFVTPEWYRAWQRAYEADAEVAVVIVRDAGAAVRGVLPLALDRAGGWGRLRFGGAGLGDRFHPAARSEDDPAVAAAAAGAVGALGWATMVLDNVEAAASWPQALIAASSRRLTSRSYRAGVLPRIDLREVDGWEAYLATRSRNLRSQLRRRERALARDHGAHFRQTEEAKELDADLKTFFRLHDARWGPRGGSSSRGERAREFHRRFAAAALRRGWLRLWFLELGDRPVASWYGWSFGGTYSYYLAGFDPEFARLGVGGVLMAHTVREAIEEGAREYDLLLGDEPYKGRLAGSHRDVCTRVITPVAHPARVAAATEAGLWRAAQRLPAERRRRIRRGLAGIVERLPGARSR